MQQLVDFLIKFLDFNNNILRFYWLFLIKFSLLSHLASNNPISISLDDDKVRKILWIYAYDTNLFPKAVTTHKNQRKLLAVKISAK